MGTLLLVFFALFHIGFSLHILISIGIRNEPVVVSDQSRRMLERLSPDQLKEFVVVAKVGSVFVFLGSAILFVYMAMGMPVWIWVAGASSAIYVATTITTLREDVDLLGPPEPVKQPAKTFMLLRSVLSILFLIHWLAVAMFQ